MRGEVEEVAGPDRHRHERDENLAQGLSVQMRGLGERRVHREQQRHLQEDRQAAHRRVVAALLVQLHLLGAEAGLVVAVLRLEVVHRRRELLHRPLIADLGHEERVEREADGDGDDDDREPEVVHQVVRPDEQRDERMDEQEVPVGLEERHQWPIRCGTGS